MGQESLPEQQQSTRGCSCLTVHPAAGSALHGAWLVLHCNMRGTSQDKLLSQVLSMLHTMGPGTGVLLYFTPGFLTLQEQLALLWLQINSPKWHFWPFTHPFIYISQLCLSQWVCEGSPAPSVSLQRGKETQEPPLSAQCCPPRPAVTVLPLRCSTAGWYSTSTTSA